MKKVNVMQKRKIESCNEKDYTYILGLLAFFLVITGLFIYSPSVISGANDQNDTAFIRVNVSNTAPYATSIVLSDADGGNIDLTPGDTIVVYCNATIYDPNGYGDISTVNATISHVSLNDAGAHDGTVDADQSRYTNSSCTSTSGSGLISEYTCSFNVYWFALNGTWTCNMSITDTFLLGEQGITYNDTTQEMNTLLALNVTETLDFGAIQALTTTSDRNATVYNLGNRELDLRMYGYGNTDSEAQGDNNSMNCDVGNISIGMLKYNYSSVNADFNINMTNLTASYNANTWNEYNLAKSNDTGYSGSYNMTYWKLFIPTGVRGYCNGTIVFAAIDGDSS